MKFVVDTNLVFSAILNTQGKIGDLLMNSQGVFEFYSCETLRAELNNHAPKLLELSGLSDAELALSIYQITSHIHFINESLIPFEYWLKAADLVREVDMDDIAFVSLTEFLQVKLWTGDKELLRGLAKKGYTNFTTTEELYTLRALLE